MEVYFRGLNIHNWLPSTHKLIESFTKHEYPDLRNIEVSYYFTVLLVADNISIKGIHNRNIQLQNVKQITCNDNTILVLLESGDLFKIDDENRKIEVKLTDLTEGDLISSISQGSKLTVILTKTGHMYNYPNKLEFSSREIKEIKTGQEHCIFVDTQGKVYTFGRGSRGQLGHGSLEDEEEPKFVEALGGVKIRGVAAGGWHCCALSEEGDVYLWGWNGNGQLGSETASVLATPTVLDLDVDFTGIACGVRHTIVFTKKGEVYGCGWNKYKQLSGDSRENIKKMEFLGKFERIKDVRCGPWNTVILCV